MSRKVYIKEYNVQHAVKYKCTRFITIFFQLIKQRMYEISFLF